MKYLFNLSASGEKFICTLLFVAVLSGAAFAATFTVINVNDSGTGSFRQAILDANLSQGLDTIVFSIDPGGVQTINVTGSLPELNDAVILDATTQPGHNVNPIIELRGTPFGMYGLVINAGNTTIRGFVINGFGSGGIGIFDNGGNLIENNFIGTTIAGTTARSNGGQGINIFNSSNNIIGGTTPTKRNLISGNQAAGIFVNGTSNANNIIQGNYIGTDITGAVKIPNQREGICLCSSNPGFSLTGNLIGGTSAGAGNLVAGNSTDEIRLQGFATSENTVQGNLIGTNASGTQSIPSDGNGLSIGIARNNIIGGTAPGAGNVISGSIFGSASGGSGLILDNSTGNIVKGNFIGTDITGTRALPNSAHGVVIGNGTNNNVIGGTEHGEGNIIAFNGNRGITVGNSTPIATISNAIRGNSIFSNGLAGIDLLPGNGVNPNDPCDADAGVNNLQNYPVLASAVANATGLTVTGSLNSAPNETFAIDFFTNFTYDSTEFGEGKTYIGSATVTTAANCGTDFIAVLPFPLAGNQFITATATDSNGNTSEFSQYVRASGPGIKANFDFDADGRSDISVFRPSNGIWYLQQSESGLTGLSFGQAGDVIVPADYDGDGKTDVAVFRGGIWYLQRSTLGFTGVAFGSADDIPVPADYDADGRADVAVFRPSNGTWYLLQSTGGFTGITFGQAGDKPVPADYDGDGKTDIAVNRSGTWYIQRSSLGFTGVVFGVATDKLVPADYDGDGKTDVAVFRPSNGNWYLQRSSLGFTGITFGISTDAPAPADYDGDGKADVAVFRNGTWYLLQSTAGFTGVTFGATTDKPIPNAFVQ